MCQVLEIWKKSHNAQKRQYAMNHEGVVELTLVDFGRELDTTINSYLSDVDSAASVDELTIPLQVKSYLEKV